MLFTAEPGEELYYRFTIPSVEASDFGLEKGKKYILSGQISLQKYQDSSQSFDTAGNIEYVAVRTQKSKNGSYSGGINKKILEEFTTNSTVDDISGVVNRNWGEPTFVDFAVDFTVENDAENYYISFQLYPKVNGQNAAACLCLKNLKLYEAGLYGEISPTNGFALWKGLKGDGSTTNDTNLVFKVDESGAFLKGQIHAAAGGTIGGWNIGSHSITTGTLGSTNSFYMYSSGSTMLSIGSHFSVDNTGALYASAGNIAGFYINPQDMTIYTDGTTTGIENVLGFISKGTQTGQYAVGTSGLKQNWFIWNKGGANGSTITETDADGNIIEGIKGVFGVDMDGSLYTIKGSIGGWTICETKLENDQLSLYSSLTDLTNTSLIDQTAQKRVIDAGYQKEYDYNTHTITKDQDGYSDLSGTIEDISTSVTDEETGETTTTTTPTKTITVEVVLPEPENNSSYRPDSIVVTSEVKHFWSGDQYALISHTTDIESTVTDNQSLQLTIVLEREGGFPNDSTYDITVKYDTQKEKENQLVNFQLLADGSLYTNSIKISGASQIGGWKLESDGLKTIEGYATSNAVVGGSGSSKHYIKLGTKTLSISSPSDSIMPGVPVYTHTQEADWFDVITAANRVKSFPHEVLVKNGWIGYKNTNNENEYIHFSNGICDGFSKDAPKSGYWITGDKI